MWWSKPKQWWEIGQWIRVVGGKEYWVPLDKETIKLDVIIKFGSYRRAELALRRIREQGNLSMKIREMTEDSLRVVCQHSIYNAQYCPAYEHTYEGVMEEIDADNDF